MYGYKKILAEIKLICGNISGVKKIYLKKLEDVLGVRSKTFISPEILSAVVQVSAAVNREICVAISRKGKVAEIRIGNAKEVGLPEGIKDGNGFCGIRILHTHTGGSARFSDMDISALVALEYDAMAVAAIDGKGNITGSSVAYLTRQGAQIFENTDLQSDSLVGDIVTFEQEYRANADKVFSTAPEKERAVLVGLAAGDYDPVQSITELAELAKTAGAEVAKIILQQKAAPEPATMIGTGKLAELKNTVQVENANLVIFDNELSGVQVKNLEAALGVKVIDRPVLILDIFAGRATSSEGKLQVELAQLKYNLPRLIGIGGRMDKLRSGIGMRGPGEKKLEVDRRIIRTRVQDIEKRIKNLQAERDLRREKRKNSKTFSVALVGYTNSGKSTLMNALSNSNVLAEDKLFATLDPVTRLVKLDKKREFLLTDTVGFVSRLPHEFIDAFSSTLEEAKYADLLLHVMDASGTDLNLQYRVVEEVLKKIGAANKPVINIYNKCDKRAEPQEQLPTTHNTVQISALKGDNLDTLINMILTHASEL